MVMYMDGFRSSFAALHSGPEPLNFLFLDLTLNTPLKIALAMVASLLLGVVTEFVVNLRRKQTGECVRLARRARGASSNSTPLLGAVPISKKLIVALM